MTQSGHTTLGTRLLWAALIIWTCGVLLSWATTPFNLFLVIVQVAAFLIWFFINVQVSAGHAWARIFCVVTGVPGVLILVLVTALILKVPSLTPVNGLFVLAELWFPGILQTMGLLLVFSETSSGGRIGVVFMVSVALVAGAAVLLEPRMMAALISDPKSPFFLITVANKAKQEQRLPAMIDDDTEAFDVKARTGMLIYCYRLVKVNASGFDAREYLDRMRPVVTEHFCKQDSQGLLKQGVVMRASYVDRSNGAIGSLDVGQSDCEAAAASEPTHHEVWKKYVSQPETQGAAQPETPWQSATATPTPTTPRRARQSVETPEMKVEALVEDGNQQLKQGNYEAAIKDFKAVLAINPDNYAARSGLQEAQRMR